ncbi:hypothetical protein CORC01_09703 [Colletotrichum orchidophilum]|uniref:Uncharacterized protein n=1 Tax=Colletotrichum orchidophilum TaxID=1209926 RepID=A0A1G4B113_9PEZI|nr:uncharacterized protein CORC01_09703 [Colletotrichum orchidophilum]OHE95046.1 hypothetical protein CORC01_09703 [Colletotrichum orchidophilum]
MSPTPRSDLLPSDQQAEYGPRIGAANWVYPEARGRERAACMQPWQLTAKPLLGEAGRLTPPGASRGMPRPVPQQVGGGVGAINSGAGVAPVPCPEPRATVPMTGRRAW